MATVVARMNNQVEIFRYVSGDDDSPNDIATLDNAPVGSTYYDSAGNVWTKSVQNGWVENFIWC